MMSYVWSLDGLFLLLHIQLDRRDSREAADRMALTQRADIVSEG